MTIHAIGFGSLNLDEIWETTRDFLEDHHLRPGSEYVRDIAWFERVYPLLKANGTRKALEPGGSAANMIAALARMGFETGFYGTTGKDDAKFLRLQDLGKPQNLRVRQMDVPAGRCLALIDREDDDKDRVLVILPNANDHAGAREPEVEYFEQAQWVHLTSFVSSGPLQAQVRLVETLSQAVKVSFDPGAIYCEKGLETLRPLLKRANLLFVTTEELQKLTGERSFEQGASLLLGMGISTIVVKMGAEGIGVFVPRKFIMRPAVSPGELKDRTGAGDVAAAGFLAGMLESIDLEECLLLAAAAASKSIEGYGRSSYPDKSFFRLQLSRLGKTRRSRG
ncbi:MAG TPA: carbohydrate kinase family protein [Desulfomonilaceae bacterium]|nr:carbohydrate kinase family protein [Desulfomonilaceae bacterium]